MATARVIAIKGDELETYLAKQATLASLKGQVRQLEAELKAEEEGLLSRLKAGAKVASGWVATIQTKLGQVRPPWKDEFQGLAMRCGLNPGEEVAKVIGAFVPESKDVLVVVKK